MRKPSSYNNTSFFGTTIRTTPNKLIALADKLGAFYDDNNTGRGKTNFDFEFETEDGDYFTVYDWKEYRPLNLDGNCTFHIGGKDKSVTQKAQQELLANL